jgi:glycosyltransferase involved in cell wall biosynthesis
MSALRVLIVAYHFPPEAASGSLRMSYLAKYLPEFGWDPTVITRQADAPPRPDVIRVGRAPAASNGAAAPAVARSQSSLLEPLKEVARNVVFFPDRAGWWIPLAIAAGLKAHSARRYDAVLSSAMPASVHVAGRALATALRIPWIADYRDLWHGNPYVADPPWRAAVLRGLERFLLRGASSVTTVAPALAQSLSAFHQRSVTTIGNTYDPAEWVGIPFADPGEFRIVHTGTLYFGRRSPERLFAALSELRAAGEFGSHRVRVDFYGPDSGDVMALAGKHGVQDLVSYHGIVDRNTAMRAQRAAAALLVIQSDDPRTVSEYGSKIFEYQAAGRPVIALAPRESVLREYLQRHQIGWSASTIEEIKDALRAAYAFYAQGRSLPEVAEPFTARTAAADFATLLSAAVRPVTTRR